jgi:hypothetical protein
MFSDCLGLEKIECKDTAAEEVRKLFLEYFSYVFPSRTNVLKEQWEKFDKCDEQLKGWMSGNFAYDPLF